MLDAFKIGAGGKKTQRTAADELEALIRTAKEERSALGEMLTQVTIRSGKLMQAQKSLEQFEKAAATTVGKVDELAERLASLDERTRVLEDVDEKIRNLVETVEQAQNAAERVVGPEGDLRKHRDAVEQLSSQALETRASLDALREDRASLEDLRAELRQTQMGLRTSLDQAGGLKTELDQVREAATILGQDYARIREASREAREDSGAAMESVKAVEQRLGPLAQLHELSKNTEERLISLNALAEHVTHKAKALENQKHTIDHAMVEANRLNEMVWAMDSGIARLNEGSKEVARTEEMLGRMEKLVAETTSRLDHTSRAKDELTRDLARFERDGVALTESLRGHVERLGVDKKEFEAFDERLRTLQTSVGEAEGRMEALAAKDKDITELDQRADALAKHFQELFAQNDDLAKKQEAMELLHTRLDQVDELSRRTNSQLGALNQSRHDLEALRKEITDFHESYAQAAQLGDKLASDRAALEAKLGADVAALMLTNPNTCGLFEREIIEIADAVHAAGAFFYCDGANFNAIVGRVRPADLGIDCMHLNLHKTFSTPHGGGGPGSGPVALAASLAPYAPLPWIVHGPNGLELVEHKSGAAEHSLGRLKGYHGQMGMFVRALAYMMSHGADGLRQVAEDAVLNANYLRARLEGELSLSFPGPCMHEVLFEDRFLKDTGVTTLDFAKALIDEGYHPMTIYFPLIVHGAMLIEPTETESKASLDQFVEVLKALAAAARSGEVSRFQAAPVFTPRRRLDETTAARKPVLRWRPEPERREAAE